jgi:hypothetical protein
MFGLVNNHTILNACRRFPSLLYITRLIHAILPAISTRRDAGRCFANVVTIGSPRDICAKYGVLWEEVAVFAMYGVFCGVATEAVAMHSVVFSESCPVTFSAACLPNKVYCCSPCDEKRCYSPSLLSASFSDGISSTICSKYGVFYGVATLC